MNTKDRDLGRAAHYMPNESITASVVGTIEVVLEGRGSLERGLLIATESRLVFFTVTIAGPRILTYPYERIGEVAVDRGIIGNEIRFTAAGQSVVVKWIDDPELQTLAEVLTQRAGVVTRSLVSVGEQSRVVAGSGQRHPAQR